MGFDTVEINLVLPYYLVQRFSVWQKWTILEDSFKKWKGPQKSSDIKNEEEIKKEMT